MGTQSHFQMHDSANICQKCVAIHLRILKISLCILVESKPVAWWTIEMYKRLKFSYVEKCCKRIFVQRKCSPCIPAMMSGTWSPLISATICTDWKVDCEAQGGCKLSVTAFHRTVPSLELTAHNVCAGIWIVLLDMAFWYSEIVFLLFSLPCLDRWLRNPWLRPSSSQLGSGFEWSLHRATPSTWLIRSIRWLRLFPRCKPDWMCWSRAGIERTWLVLCFQLLWFYVKV